MYLAYKDTNILFKILPCILIAIFLVMAVSSNVFASSTSREITGPDGQVGTITNEKVLAYDNIFIINDGQYASIYLCNGGYFCMGFKEDDTSGYKVGCYDADGKFVYYKKFGTSGKTPGATLFDKIINRLNSVTDSDLDSNYYRNL